KEHKPHGQHKHTCTQTKRGNAQSHETHSSTSGKVTGGDQNGQRGCCTNEPLDQLTEWDASKHIDSDGQYDDRPCHQDHCAGANDGPTHRVCSEHKNTQCDSHPEEALHERVHVKHA